MYKGKCAECNAEGRSKAFKSRRAGYDLPVVDERRLGFASKCVKHKNLWKLQPKELSAVEA
jgi:hypothetical protein